TILMKTNECVVPLSQACITPLLPAPLSLSGPTIWYQHSLTTKIRAFLNSRAMTSPPTCCPASDGPDGACALGAPSADSTPRRRRGPRLEAPSSGGGWCGGAAERRGATVLNVMGAFVYFFSSAPPGVAMASDASAW